MAPLPPAANVIKYTQSWILQGNLRAESILHFLYAGGPPATADCQAIAAAIQASAVTNFKGRMGSNNKVGLGTVLDIASNTGAQGQGGITTSGTLATLSNPASTCVVVNHQIARRYRGGKPRTYCPFGTANELNSEGTWTAAFTGNVSTSFSTFLTTALAASSGGVTLTHFVNVSYFHAGALRGTPVVDNIVASLARQPIGTQRRRNKGA
jgi:hypothetical protein